MTIRDEINKLSEELKSVDALGPHRAAEMRIEASSLISSLNKHLSEKLFALNKVKLTFLDEYGSAAKARIHAESSPEFKEWHDAYLQKEALKSIISALGSYLRNAEDEMRHSKY